MMATIGQARGFRHEHRDRIGGLGGKRPGVVVRPRTGKPRHGLLVVENVYVPAAVVGDTASAYLATRNVPLDTALSVAVLAPMFLRLGRARAVPATFASAVSGSVKLDVDVSRR